MRPILLPALLVTSLLLTACGGEPAAAPTAIPAPTQPPATATSAASPTPEATATPSSLSTEQLVDKLRPSTVLIRAAFGATAISTEGLGEGTGIVYDTK